MARIGVNHFATFHFEDPAAAPKAHGRSVRDFAAALHRDLDLPGAKPDAPFGDEELSIFSVALGDAEFSVGVSAKGQRPKLERDLGAACPTAASRLLQKGARDPIGNHATPRRGAA